jgi:hypothetical protein
MSIKHRWFLTVFGVATLLTNCGSPQPKLNEENKVAGTEPTEEEIRQRHIDYYSEYGESIFLKAKKMQSIFEAYPSYEEVNTDTSFVLDTAIALYKIRDKGEHFYETIKDNCALVIPKTNKETIPSFSVVNTLANCDKNKELDPCIELFRPLSEAIRLVNYVLIDEIIVQSKPMINEDLITFKSGFETHKVTFVNLNSGKPIYQFGYTGQNKDKVDFGLSYSETDTTYLNTRLRTDLEQQMVYAREKAIRKHFKITTGYNLWAN